MLALELANDVTDPSCSNVDQDDDGIGCVITEMSDSSQSEKCSNSFNSDSSTFSGSSAETSYSSQFGQFSKCCTDDSGSESGTKASSHFKPCSDCFCAVSKALLVRQKKQRSEHSIGDIGENLQKYGDCNPSMNSSSCLKFSE